ncbi:MAG TPA: DUF2207 domain-containing protein, partial [Devosia sp.]|nr:DUF2207 domain-containing protein [Devosia sp.]
MIHMLRHRARAIALALLVLLTAVLPAVAREEIRSFATDITLRVDGSVEVTETIAVNVEGDEIRRGIYRDIPTQLINPDNTRLRSDLRVLEVLRDGAAEPYAISNMSGGFRRI